MSKRTHDHQCQHRTRQHGTETQCPDIGGWVYDAKAKTWKPAHPNDTKRRCWLHGPGSERAPAGRGRKADKPNARVQRYAALLLGMSPEVTKALREVDEELSLLGFPGCGGGGSSSGDDDGPVARDAVRIHELTAWREDLRDWIEDVGTRLDVGLHIIRQIRNLPPAAMGVKLCAEGQQGRQGSIEWGDPTCTELPVRDGLCAACRERERVWRKVHELPGREEPAA